MDNPGGRGWLLAIDTATDQAAVAIFDGITLHERSWAGGRQQTTTVLREVEAMLHVAGVMCDQISVVAVSIGPGSFTGLRVGLSIAKGLALANDCSLVGVSTLSLAAAAWQPTVPLGIAVVPAGRGRVVWAQWAGDKLQSPQNTELAVLLQAIAQTPGVWVTGDIPAEQRVAILAAGGTMPMVSLAYRRPGLLAELGRDQFLRGKSDDSVMLEPVYVHGRPNPR